MTELIATAILILFLKYWDYQELLYNMLSSDERMEVTRVYFQDLI